MSGSLRESVHPFRNWAARFPTNLSVSISILSKPVFRGCRALARSLEASTAPRSMSEMRSSPNDAVAPAPSQLMMVVGSTDRSVDEIFVSERFCTQTRDKQVSAEPDVLLHGLGIEHRDCGGGVPSGRVAGVAAGELALEVASDIVTDFRNVPHFRWFLAVQKCMRHYSILRIQPFVMASAGLGVETSEQQPRCAARGCQNWSASGLRWRVTSISEKKVEAVVVFVVIMGILMIVVVVARTLISVTCAGSGICRRGYARGT
ncbi:hypothetical protein FJTKL_06299 [Diaporthe vaccinii]|uniref:Uncharacterized protein n=1 Tax=Diaporthe vaccinii TaxID=105482 RepID=A0ABR4DQA5_9PEZI